MKTKITLNISELEYILDLAKKFNTDVVTIKFNNDSGIGSLVHAEFDIVYQDVPGVYSVTVTDESKW